MKISKETVEQIAHLARLDIDEPLKETLSEQLSHILDYIDTLKDVDVKGVKPSSGAAFITNVLREDEVVPSPGPAVTLDGAPEREEDFYTVPRVVK